MLYNKKSSFHSKRLKFLNLSYDKSSKMRGDVNEIPRKGIQDAASADNETHGCNDLERRPIP